MSRIGRMPITVPAGVDVKIDGQHVTVKKDKTEMNLDVHPSISVKMEGSEIIVERHSDDKDHRALHGLTRAISRASRRQAGKNPRIIELSI